MPEIEIRPAVKANYPELVNMSASYETNHVWQLERVKDDSQVNVTFRLARLPRTIKVDYPRPPAMLTEAWLAQSMVLAAFNLEKVVGYVRLTDTIAPDTIWITDLVLKESLRRKGIAKALIMAVQDWAVRRKIRRVSIEMQSKNYPAIQLVHKLGYEFSGFIDHYYPNNDIAIIFTGFVR